MKKGQKMKGKGYSSVNSQSGGLNFRLIAEKMSEDGDPMTYAEARSEYMTAMFKIAQSVCKAANENHNFDEMKVIAQDPQFQNAIHEMIFSRKL